MRSERPIAAFRNWRPPVSDGPSLHAWPGEDQGQQRWAATAKGVVGLAQQLTPKAVPPTDPCQRDRGGTARGCGSDLSGTDLTARPGNRAQSLNRYGARAYRQSMLAGQTGHRHGGRRRSPLPQLWQVLR